MLEMGMLSIQMLFLPCSLASLFFLEREGGGGREEGGGGGEGEFSLNSSLENEYTELGDEELVARRIKVVYGSERGD